MMVGVIVTFEHRNSFVSCEVTAGQGLSISRLTLHDVPLTYNQDWQRHRSWKSEEHRPFKTPYQIRGRTKIESWHEWEGLKVWLSQFQTLYCWTSGTPRPTRHSRLQRHNGSTGSTVALVRKYGQVVCFWTFKYFPLWVRCHVARPPLWNNYSYI